MEPGDSAVSLSLDDLASFAPTLGAPSLPGGHDQSFEEGAASFLSGTDISHDTFDLVGDSTSDGYSRRTPSIAGHLIAFLLLFIPIIVVVVQIIWELQIVSQMASSVSLFRFLNVTVRGIKRNLIT